MKKKIILIITFLIILVGGIFLTINIINKNKLSEKLTEKKTVHDITFSDVKINKKDSKYVFSVTLTSKKFVEAESFDVELKDKKGKTITILSGYIGNIDSDETKVIEMETDKKINNAYELSYTVYNE